MIKKNLPHIIALLSFVLIACIYFSPQLSGKKIKQGDIMIFKGAVQEIKEHKDKTGEDALWTNSMFGGMPAYQISAPQKYNVGKYIEKSLNLWMPRPIGYFIYAMIGFYILLITMRVNPWLSIIGAIAFAFTTNNLVLFDAGHASKLRATFPAAFIIAGVIMTYRSAYWKGGLLFTLGMILSIYSNHPQMTYYLGISLGIYTLIKAIEYIKRGELKKFGIASAVLVAGTLLSLGTSAGKLLSTYEYSQDSTRGKSILQSDTSQQGASDQLSGLDFNYAMAWSNGGMDILSSFIPHAVGGGSGEIVSSDSETAKVLKRRGVNTRKGVPAPLYWGGLPSTSGPIYFGAVIFFLFLLGFFANKKSISIWIGISVALFFILSMGKNFAGFNQVFFDYFPLYNKFRTPNSILTISSVLIPFFGILGLSKILASENKNKFLKPVYITAGAMGLFCLFMAFVGPSIFDFSHPSDGQYAQRGYDMDAVKSDRISFLTSSALRSFGLILATALGLIGFLKNKLKVEYFLGILAILVVIDLIPIDKKYLNNSNFISSRAFDSTFTPRDVDKQILQDKDLHYRVMDYSIDAFNSSQSSYFHKTIGGNHAAKLQRIRDVIERHISNNNQSVFNMMNTKYFIAPQGDKVIAQRNPAALGNAWFINKVTKVNTANEEIEALGRIDPAGEVVIHKEFSNYPVNSSYNKNGTIVLTSYAPDKLTYQTNSTTDQFAVFSEMWYGPDKGWQAYINGKKVDHIRVNYLLRGMTIPSGAHEIIFEFNPTLIKTGELISLISCLIFLLIAGYYLFRRYKPA